MAKKVMETLRSVDIVLLNRLRALSSTEGCIDPRTLGPDLVEYLRPVMASSHRVVLRRYGGQAQTFDVVWRLTGVANRPWFLCNCGRRVRRMYSNDDFWACRHCHKLTYASHVSPDKAHWAGANAVVKLLHALGDDSCDPCTPLPPRRPGMWRKKYDRLARAFRIAQERFLRSIMGAANRSFAQQKHQLLRGNLAKQRKELRARTLELMAKRREAASARHWTTAAFLAGNGPSDYLLTEKEECELNELVVRNGRMEDLERFGALNPDYCRVERVRRR